jgi:putative hemolysin
MLETITSLVTTTAQLPASRHTMNSLSLEIALVLALILVNGLLSLSEMALVSARRARLEQLAEEGDSGAKAALGLAAAPTRFLSTIQIGITFVGILSGAFGGATVAEYLTTQFQEVPALAPYGKSLAMVLVVVAITYLSLVVGELVPKRLALNNPEKIATKAAPLINLFARMAYPLVLFLGGSTNFLLRLLRFQPTSEPSVTEEEIKLMLSEGARAGVFQPFEQNAIERVFRLADRRVTVLMTPRQEMIRLDLEASIEHNKELIARCRHSAYPVVEGSFDNIVGVVTTKSLLTMQLLQQPFSLKSICTPPLFVPDSSQAVDVLHLMQKSANNMAFVVDEYGMVLGLITYGDILRSVFDNLESPSTGWRGIVEREDGSWLVSGNLPFDDFLEFFSMPRIDEEDLKRISTVGGFALIKIGTVPEESQHFSWRGLRVEVVDMDGRRIDKLLVSRLPPPADDLS